MKSFMLLLVVVLPGIVIADITCPGGKICPSSQTCCKVNGQYECCDLDVEISKQDEKIYAGKAVNHSFSPSFHNTSEGVIQNGFFGECSPLTCTGTCCTEDGCCPYVDAACCSSERCCPSSNTCCNDGCCPYLTTCCEDGCCRQGYQCCNSGCCPSSSVCCGEKCCLQGSRCCKTRCCPASSTCCGDICCSDGYRCCDGWCCKKPQICGKSYDTCTNAAVGFAPAFAGLLMMVATFFVSKSNFL